MPERILRRVHLANDGERAGGVAVGSLRQAGTVVLAGLVPRATARALALTVIERAQRAVALSEVHRVGERRFMIPVPLEGEAAEPGVWRHPQVLSILRDVLGHAVVLHAFGAVVALEGADDQHVHPDHPPLYGSTGVESLLPPYAVTAVI